jgi:tRNA nucleotidyltransferase (CCA-adding enzyme)
MSGPHAGIDLDRCVGPATAELALVREFASHVGERGGRALIVGGFVRDAALAQHHQQPIVAVDLDVEVYGVAFDALAALLEPLGRVDLVGKSFGIAKLTSPATGAVIDFSIPRRDSKVGAGHRGFQVTGSPDLTVIEAARRRDLTINAMAIDPLTGELIDHFGGLDDLRLGILRATDPEFFADDPLRVLRVMQFAGRFGFTVDPATAKLCRTIDLTELPRERIGQEWIKLLTKSPTPSTGLRVARELTVLDQLHPEFAVLEQIPQEPEWHPEGDVWQHTLLATDAAAQVVRREGLAGQDAMIVLFGALCHDLGKATTTEVRMKHGRPRITAYGHEAAGVEPSRKFLTSLAINGDVIAAILPIVRDHLFHVHQPDPTDNAIHRFAQRLQPATIRLWDLVSRCDSNGRGQPFEDRTASHALYQRSVLLDVAEKPAPPIVMGRHLIALLDMTPGPAFRRILDICYDAQLSGHFSTPEEGIAYYLQSRTEAAADATTTP